MRTPLVLLITLCLLTACGGGGGSTPTAVDYTPNITIPTPVDAPPSITTPTPELEVIPEPEPIDETAPVISLNGNSQINLGLGRAYSERGATAWDDFDSEIIVDAPEGAVNSEVLGEYILTYSATDTAGNMSNITRTITITEPRPFITTWNTSNEGVSSFNKIKIPTNPEFTSYNYSVDWGDGITSENLTGDHTHTYASPGIYTVAISGDFPQIYYENSSSLWDFFPQHNDKLLTIEL